MLPQSNAKVLKEFTIPEAYFSKQEIKDALRSEMDKQQNAEMLQVYQNLLKEFNEWESKGFETERLKAFISVMNGKLSSFAYGVELA